MIQWTDAAKSLYLMMCTPYCKVGTGGRTYSVLSQHVEHAEHGACAEDPATENLVAE